MEDNKNIVYGLPGISMPGKTGNTGDTGYSMKYTDKNGYIIQNESQTINLLNDFKKTNNLYTLGSIGINVYRKEADLKLPVEQIPKYYQFNYNINGRNLDNLRIEAFLIFREENDGRNINYYYPAKTSLKDKYIILKDFDSVEKTKYLSNIKYKDGVYLRKIFVYGYVRINEFLTQKIYLGEKEFSK